jgi:hypothetical protein
MILATEITASLNGRFKIIEWCAIRHKGQGESFFTVHGKRSVNQFASWLRVVAPSTNPVAPITVKRIVIAQSNPSTNPWVKRNVQYTAPSYSSSISMSVRVDPDEEEMVWYTSSIVARKDVAFT